MIRDAGNIERTQQIAILLRQKQKRITNPAIFLTAEDPKEDGSTNAAR